MPTPQTKEGEVMYVWNVCDREGWLYVWCLVWTNCWWSNRVSLTKQTSSEEVVWQTDHWIPGGAFQVSHKPSDPPMKLIPTDRTTLEHGREGNSFVLFEFNSPISSTLTGQVGSETCGNAVYLLFGEGQSTWFRHDILELSPLFQQHSHLDKLAQKSLKNKIN